MIYFIDCMSKKYVTFDGRARRAEFWNFALYSIIALCVLLPIFGFICSRNYLLMESDYSVIGLAFVLPCLAVTIRRLHDIGMSGWYVLIALIPVIGALILFALVVQDGNKFVNRYGSDPKGGK